MAGMIDRARAEAAMAEFLSALGTHEGTVHETAVRVTSAYVDELLSGYGTDVARLIQDGSEKLGKSPDPIVLDGITTATVCPHHLLVARGEALVAYVPDTRVLGLGTVARLVDACSRRFILQEQIARDVTDAIMNHLGAQGAFCRMTFDHACLQTRGALQSRARAVTWSAVGCLKPPTALEAALGRKLVGVEP